MLQVYIDDSGCKGKGRVLFLGGIMGEAENLAALSDSWDRELRFADPGRIAYFKSDEAATLDGEFRHWQPASRDKKVRRMAELLNKPEFMAVFSGIALSSHAQMEKLLSRAVTDSRLHFFNQPIFMAFHAVLLGVAQEVVRQRVTERIEIFIDNNDVLKGEMKRQYPILLEVLDERQRNVMPSELYFRDDKEFLPLQAADLLMGDLRLRSNKNERWPKLSLEKLRLSPHSKPLTEDRLFEMTQGLTKLPLRRVPFPRTSKKK